MRYFLPLIALTLASCGKERPQLGIRIVTKTKLQSVEPDERLRSCKTTPKKRKVADETATSVLLAQLFETVDDCRSKLNSTWDAIDKNKAEVERLNSENGQ